MSTQTCTPTDVSFHLDCHIHTPLERSHFLCQPAKLQLSVFLPISPFPPHLSHLCFKRYTKTHVWSVIVSSLSAQLKQCLEKSEQTNAPDVLLNVLMWLLVLGEPTTLGKAASFVRGCVSLLIYPPKADKECLTVQLNKLCIVDNQARSTWLPVQHWKGAGGV